MIWSCGMLGDKSIWEQRELFDVYQFTRAFRIDMVHASNCIAFFWLRNTKVFVVMTMQIYVYYWVVQLLHWCFKNVEVYITGLNKMANISVFLNVSSWDKIVLFWLQKLLKFVYWVPIDNIKTSVVQPVVGHGTIIWNHDSVCLGHCDQDKMADNVYTIFDLEVCSHGLN